MKKASSNTQAKKCYNKPSLTRYGTVSEMTRQHFTSLESDAGNNRMALNPS